MRLFCLKGGLFIWFVCAWLGLPVMASVSVTPHNNLVGESRLEVLFWEIYEARLYSETGHYRPGEGFTLAIDYLRAVSASDIVSHSMEEIGRVVELDRETQARWDGTLDSIFIDVYPGDRLVGVYEPLKGASFLLNDESLGVIEEDALARAFFDIWLAETASRPHMRAQLLGMTR